MRSIFRPLILAGLFLGGAALAADTGPAREEPGDALLGKAREAVKRQDWGGAVNLLKEAVAVNPGSADTHNLYAYSLRKSASPDMNLVFKHYNEALRIDSKHRGAHEYIGEAYLMVGNVAKAKEHLAALDKICFFPCSEHADLKKAIAAHETKGK
jgi:tetratricopeptide (TPR) repeat protein